MGEWYRDEVWIDDWTWTGHPSQVSTTLKRSISNTVLQKWGVESFYIGVASGPNLQPALKKRFDEYKRSWGCNEMWALYSSTSQTNTLTLEKELVKTYREYPGFLNRISGGGSAPTSAKMKYLYLALKRSV